MEQDYKDMLHRLVARFNGCYDEYIAGILLLDKEKIVESVSEIMAVKETHMEMCFWLELSMCESGWPDCFNNLIAGPLNRKDAIALLSVENPLIDLAMKWWFYSLGNKVDFHGFYKAEKTPAVAQ